MAIPLNTKLLSILAKNVMTKHGIKILFVYANSTMDNLIPVGPSILSACLKRAGHEVKLFDTTFYQLEEETGDDARIRTLQVKKTNLADYGINKKTTNMFKDFKGLVETYKPNLIAVSCVDSTYLMGISLLKTVKEEKKIFKIIGGVGVTFSPEKAIKEDCLDAICLGEGENALVELANHLRDKKSPIIIKNLWVKENGKICKNELGDLVSLNDLPLQDWSIYEKERFYKPMGGKILITGNFEVMRGCMNQCSYCDAPAFQRLYEGKGCYVRWKKIDKVLEEIKLMKEKYNLQYVYLTAENFLALKSEEFQKFIEGYKDIRLPFWVQGRPELVLKERIEQLKNVGCEGVSMGVEHGNPEFRIKVLNRPMNNKLTIKAFRIIKEVGIRTSANNIIGFPLETRDLIFDTIKLNRKINADNVIVNVFNPYSGTKLRELAIQKGYLSPEDCAKDYRRDTTLKMPQLPREELLGLHRTFVLYVKMPRDKWSLIKKAEKFDEEGNKMFMELSELYFSKYR